MLSAYLLLALIHTDLTPELPSLGEVVRLPSVPAACMARQANEAYQDEVRRCRRMAAPWDEDNIDAALSEARALDQIWLLVAKAHGHPQGCWRDHERREALGELRDAMGPRAWVLGEWPAAIPWWRLPPLDR
jgi:hypothetical protein